jgi:menaquinone-dependent protoporphyrinogen IX oxidase
MFYHTRVTTTLQALYQLNNKPAAQCSTTPTATKEKKKHKTNKTTNTHTN